MALKIGHIDQCFSERDEAIKESVNEIFNIALEFGQSEKIIISHINKLLNVSKTRFKGFTHLNECLDHCSVAVLNENALLWANYCMIIHFEDTLKEIKLNTLARIINSAYDVVQDFNKKFVSDCLPKIIDPIIAIKSNINEIEAALNCLTVCLQKYPGWFNPVVKKVDNYILKFLESSSGQEVKFAAQAFLYLQQVGGGGLDGVNHINNFSTKFRMICVTVHNLYDEVFSNKVMVDFYQKEIIDVAGHTFSEIPTIYENVKILHVVGERILNCLTFLKIMIEKKFPVPKQIKPMELLNVIKKGLIIHNCACMENAQTDDLHLSVVTRKIQIELLKLLRSFIFWAKYNLLPFSFTINKMLHEALTLTHRCSCFSVDCVFQEMIYKVLDEWIRLSKCAIHKNFQEHLVNEIFIDILPVKNQVCLTIQNDKKHSKKSKNKAIQDRIIASGENNTTYRKLTITRRSVEETCAIFALKTLKSLFQSTYVDLPSQTLQKLYTTVLKILLEVQLGRPVHPYLSLKSQAELYGLLISFYDQDIIQILPPLESTVQILNTGCANFDKNISYICQNGLSVLEKLCQPISSSLYIDNSQKLEQNGNRVINEILTYEEDLQNTTDNSTTEGDTDTALNSNKNISIISVDIVPASDENVVSNSQDQHEERNESRSSFCEIDILKCSQPDVLYETRRSFSNEGEVSDLNNSISLRETGNKFSSPSTSINSTYSKENSATPNSNVTPNDYYLQNNVSQSVVNKENGVNKYGIDSLENLGVSENSTGSNKLSSDDQGLVVDEPPFKKIKSEEIDIEEDDMFNSFVDEVNY